jgi:hypothetical protein
VPVNGVDISVEAERQIAALDPALVLTGTSMNAQMVESEVIGAARRHAVPSVAVLDSWLNYRQRFETRAGLAVPDRIAVMDERSRDEMVASGFDPASLVVTGQPALDALVETSAAFTAERRAAVRRAWGVERDERVVLFVSQPLRALYGSDSGATGHFGFDEVGVLTQLIENLEGLAQRDGARIALVLRRHPREARDAFTGRSSAAIRLIVSDEPGSRDAAMSADLVVGMNSILLLEACYLGAIVVSLQPGLCRADVLPTNASGLSIGVRTADGVAPAVERWLMDEEARDAQRDRLAAATPPGGATSRVAALARAMMESKR